MVIRDYIKHFEDSLQVTRGYTFKTTDIEKATQKLMQQEHALLMSLECAKSALGNYDSEAR